MTQPDAPQRYLGEARGSAYVAALLFLLAAVCAQSAFPLGPGLWGFVDNNTPLYLGPFVIASIVLAMDRSRPTKWGMVLLVLMSASGTVAMIVQYPWRDTLIDGTEAIRTRYEKHYFASDVLFAAGYSILLVSSALMLAAQKGRSRV